MFYLKTLAEINDKLDAINNKLDQQKEEYTHMTVELDELSAQVEQNTTVEASAIVLLQGLSAQLSAMANDPVKIKALADELKASATSLADAVAANTPIAVSNN